MILAFLFFILITLPVRMTYRIPYLFRQMLLCTHIIERASYSIFYQMIVWLLYLATPPIAWLILSLGSIFCLFMSPIIYFWQLLWHPNGRSILEMLRDPNGDGDQLPPDPGDKPSKVRRCPVPRWVWRRRSRALKYRWRSRFERSHDYSFSYTRQNGWNMHVSQHSSIKYRKFEDWTKNGWAQNKHGCHDQPIRGYDSRLYMHSYYQMDAANINRCNRNISKEDSASTDAAKFTLELIYDLASTFHSAAKIIFEQRPLKPPDGFITASLTFLAAIAIYSSLVAIGLIRILVISLFGPKQPSKKRKRRKRSPVAKYRKKLKRLKARLSALPFLDATDQESNV